MYSLDKVENLVPIDISEVPIKLYLDKESNTIVFDTEYDIVFASKGNIIQSAKGKNVILGGEIHLNPKEDVINKDKLLK